MKLVSFLKVAFGQIMLDSFLFIPAILFFVESSGNSEVSNNSIYFFGVSVMLLFGAIYVIMLIIHFSFSTSISSFLGQRATKKIESPIEKVKFIKRKKVVIFSGLLSVNLYYKLLLIIPLIIGIVLTKQWNGWNIAYASVAASMLFIDFLYFTLLFFGNRNAFFKMVTFKLPKELRKLERENDAKAKTE